MSPSHIAGRGERSQAGLGFRLQASGVRPANRAGGEFLHYAPHFRVSEPLSHRPRHLCTGEVQFSVLLIGSTGKGNNKGGGAIFETLRLSATPPPLPPHPPPPPTMRPVQ